MVEILHNQEILTTSKIIKYFNQIIQVTKDIIEIPLDGKSNSDGWSLGKYMEAIYIVFTEQ